MNAERQRCINWIFWRRLCQAAVVLFYLGLPLANRFGFRAVAGSMASLRLGPFDLNEPAAALTAALAGRTITWALIAGIAPLALLALTLGPVFCSWACPWGLLSEKIDSLRQRFSPRPWPTSGWQKLRRARALILSGFLLFSLFSAIPLAALLSAPRLITTLPLEAIYLGIISPVTGSLLLLLLLLEAAGPRRLWCRALCPAGTLASYLRTHRTAAVTFALEQCLCPHTPICQQTCPWGIDPRHAKRFDGCTNCLRCVEACPSAALQFSSFSRDG